MEIVSLFSGAGGLDLGLIQAGHHVIWANDIEGYVRNLMQTSTEITILRRKKKPLLKKVWDVLPPTDIETNHYPQDNKG